MELGMESPETERPVTLSLALAAFLGLASAGESSSSSSPPSAAALAACDWESFPTPPAAEAPPALPLALLPLPPPATLIETGALGGRRGQRGAQGKGVHPPPYPTSAHNPSHLSPLSSPSQPGLSPAPPRTSRPVVAVVRVRALLLRSLLARCRGPPRLCRAVRVVR